MVFDRQLKIRIIKLVSILQKYPIKEQGLKFPRFFCFFGGGFLTFLVIYFTSGNSRWKSNRKQNLKRLQWLKNMKFPRFPTFWFWSIPEIENLEISESFCLLQFLVNSKSKNQKKWPQTENHNFKMRFNKKKWKFSIFCSFQFWSTPKIENSEISESFLLLQFLVIYETQHSKIKKMV